MTFILFTCLGGYLLAIGLKRGIRRATRAGAAVLALAAWDLGVLLWALESRNDVGIRIDLVAFLPLGLYLSWRGDRGPWALPV